MKLFVGGKPLNLREVPPSVAKIKAFLDASKDGELFGVIQVADGVGVHVKAVQDKHRFLSGYVVVRGHGVKLYYGMPATIRELRRQLAKEKK